LQLLAFLEHQLFVLHVWYPVLRSAQQTIPSEVGGGVGGGVTNWVGGGEGGKLGKGVTGCFEGESEGWGVGSSVTG
jgi:hypothetical protein